MSVVKSLSEFKFFKSFRLPIVSGDDVHFSVEKEDPFTERGEFIKDAQLVDASITGLGFKTTEKVALEEEVKISFSYKRLRFDVTGRVVRAISGHSSDPKLIYGIEIEDNEDRENMSRFLGQLISSFSHDRLRDCVKNLALAERYADMDEGFEMFSLLLSLFKDVTQFGHKEGFIDSMLVEVTRLINAQKAMVFLINTETNELEAHSATGIDKSILKFDYRKGVAGTVFTTGVSLNIDAKHERIKSFEKLDKKTGIETKSVICSPVYNREDKIIGVIQILNKKNQDRFSEEDEKTMRMLSLVFSCFFSQYNPMSEKSLVRRFSAPNARQIIYIGRSESTTNLRKMILKLKDQTSPLLICGEKGTGKSLYANILHAEGSRGVQDFEAIHCVGYPENEWNDKLFGTGDSVGSLQKCNGGTICFEEIWAMPRAVQHNLVKIMKDGKLNPNDQIKLDMRFIFTSSVELEDSFSKAKLVPELFEMIHTYRVNLEPLRNRKRDIGEMIDFFIAKECKDQGFLLKVLSDEIRDAFIDYEWPNNVRELKTAIARLVKYNPKNHVITEVDDEVLPILKAPVKAHLSSEIPFVNDFSIELKDRVLLVEREMMLAEIKRLKGNKSKAAKVMGISREALRKKLLQSDEVLERLGKHNLIELSSQKVNLDEEKDAA